MPSESVGPGSACRTTLPAAGLAALDGLPTGACGWATFVNASPKWAPASSRSVAVASSGLWSEDCAIGCNSLSAVPAVAALVVELLGGASRVATRTDSSRAGVLVAASWA